MKEISANYPAKIHLSSVYGKMASTPGSRSNSCKNCKIRKEKKENESNIRKIF